MQGRLREQDRGGDALGADDGVAQGREAAGPGDRPGLERQRRGRAGVRGRGRCRGSDVVGVVGDGDVGLGEARNWDFQGPGRRLGGPAGGPRGGPYPCRGPWWPEHRSGSSSGATGRGTRDPCSEHRCVGVWTLLVCGRALV